jgi:hypothetical protein
VRQTRLQQTRLQRPPGYNEHFFPFIRPKSMFTRIFDPAIKLSLTVVEALYYTDCLKSMKT